MPPTGHPDATAAPDADGSTGRRRLVVAVAAGLALIAALIGLQLVDEGDGPARGRTSGGASASTPGR